METIIPHFPQFIFISVNVEIIKILSPYFYYNKKKEYMSRGKTEADINLITQNLRSNLLNIINYI